MQSASIPSKKVSTESTSSAKSANADAGPAVLPDDLAFLGAIQRCSPLDVPEPSAASARRLRVFLRCVTRDFLGKELKSERFLDELE